MSINKMSDRNHQEFTSLLSAYSNQDDSMLESIDGISLENVHTVSLDYLNECMSDLESKDSGIRLSPGSPGMFPSDHRMDKFTEHDLANLDIALVKEGDLYLKSESKFEKNNVIIPRLGHEIYKTKNNLDYTQNSESILAISIENLQRNCKTCVEVCGEREDAFMKLDQIQKNTLIHDSELDKHNELCSGEFIIKAQKNNETECHKGPSKSEYSTDRDSEIEKSSDTEEPAHDCKIDDEDKSCDNKIKVELLPQACEQCPMTFKYKRHLDRHLEGHQKNNCPYCDAKFARKKHLDVHLFRLHGERITKYPHTCDICLKGFPKRLLLNRHKANHHNEKAQTCADCGDILDNSLEALKHSEKHSQERRFHCDKCPQAFSMEQKYLIHVKNHDTYKCPRCESGFASKKRANEHYRLKHSAKVPKEPETSITGMFYCNDCRHNFMTKDSYLRHLKTASHLSKMHAEIPLKALFTCTICTKQLTSRKALDQHIRRVHRDEKKYSCDTQGCEFHSTNKSDLERHRQLHIEERNIVCEHCGKTFTTISILKDHVLYVHNMERQFVCEECGKAFKRNSLLNRHKMSHQQIRPFTCEQCGAAFKRSHHLTRHMESCHRITLEKKKRVVKLMKTEDGRLVPIPEEPKKPKTKRVKSKKDSQLISYDESSASVTNRLLISKDMAELSTELSHVTPMSTITSSESTDMSLGLSNTISEVDSVPQILSLVDVNSGQVVTVEVTNPDTLPLTDLVDQFEANCNEILGLSSYPDLEFQNGILNTEQNYYDQVSYAELPLENVGESSLLLDPNSSKMDSLPAIENYLTQPFSPFLNL
ncbi:zinc finger protein 93-like isoform X1 [Neodiprion virginianus]|uniref:zinc finger protein 93-like isoform X1 n=2 Tax=Neodiprion virginianus TaxID=2961670 RepID=UPI001EE7627A|nr:zinc finger protein 93-like isoform X1 [Neodiprion virginianus]